MSVVTCDVCTKGVKAPGTMNAAGSFAVCESDGATHMKVNKETVAVLIKSPTG